MLAQGEMRKTDPERLEIQNAVNFCLVRGILPRGLDYRIQRRTLGGKLGVLYWVNDPVDPTRSPKIPPTWVDPVDLLQAADLSQTMGGRRLDF